MTEFYLGSPRDAEDLIVRLFGASARCTLAVQENRAFKTGRWLQLGEVALFPSGVTQEELESAVSRGQFEWKLPALDAASAELEDILVGASNDAARRAFKLKRALDAVAAIAVRAGLIHPHFDSHSLAAMPYRRPTTIVADTSGVSNGALDFVARFLHPAARVKVPALTQMEIVNFSHRFISGRRATSVKGPDLLIDHLISQGSQRVLLRLELHSDVEIERTFLLGDPLRSAFTQDADKDIKDLNLSTDVPAYADRLILEAARHHQAQASPGHPVLLLTSDQGLARMALAEGIAPLFFRSVVASDLFGRRLTGAAFHPFTGQLRLEPISRLLWELSTAFGSVRLAMPDGTQGLEVAAFGENLSWSPYQSRGDLLWIRSDKIAPWPSPTVVAGLPAPSSPRKSRPAKERAIVAARPAKQRVLAKPRQAASGPAWYRFNVQSLLTLIDRLDDRREMSDDEVLETLDTGAKGTLNEYKRFLISGNLISIDGQRWLATDDLQALAIALRQADAQVTLAVFVKVPSFARFVESLTNVAPGLTWDPSTINRGAQTYMTLGELLRVGAPIHKEGFYPTLNEPSVDQFAELAVQEFEHLARGEGLVASGAWLEGLVRDHGIHPEVSRARLAEASAAALLQRSTEGSTTDTRHDSHAIAVLRLRSGHPTVERIHLYRGDYLIPGKSSTSLRIQEVPDEPA